MLYDIEHQGLDPVGQRFALQTPNRYRSIGILISYGLLIEVHLGVLEPLILDLLEEAHMRGPITSVDVITFTLAGDEHLQNTLLDPVDVRHELSLQ